MLKVLVSVHERGKLACPFGAPVTPEEEVPLTPEYFHQGEGAMYVRPAVFPGVARSQSAVFLLSTELVGDLSVK